MYDHHAWQACNSRDDSWQAWNLHGNAWVSTRAVWCKIIEIWPIE